MRHVARKVATVEGGLVWFGGVFTTGILFPDRWTCIWQYSPLRTEPLKSYWVYLRIPWWYLGQQYINRKGSFSLLFLYHYVFPCPLQYFPKWHWNARGAVPWDVTMAYGGAAVPPLTARGSRSPSYRVCGSESQKRSRGQSQERGREVEDWGGGGEEEEDDGVPPATSERGTRGRGCPIGGGWRIPGRGVQAQRGHH